MLVNRSEIKAPIGLASPLMLFECNSLRASSKNMTPWLLLNLSRVCKRVDNKLSKSLAAKEPRPEHFNQGTSTRAP